MFYSAKQNTWFDPAFRDDYEKNGYWPDDAKEYPVEVFHAVVSNRPLGKIMAPDENGDPVLIDPPAPTTEQLANHVRAVRDEKLAETGWMIERHHEQLAASIATTLTEEQYVALLAYRQALRDVPEQQGFPAAVTWPTKPL